MGDYIYGPVPSRRLGLSLGVDLLPAKICSYDCIYCQLGPAPAQSLKRRPYRPADQVLEQLWRKLKSGVKPDCITLAGSGEPTLNSDIGRVISQIKAGSSLPVVVLTNSSLLTEVEVRESLNQADLVIPSLDAYNSSLFKTINRPHKSLDFDCMVQGLTTFAQEFPGTLWLEIFIMAGLNAAKADAEKFKPLVEKIKPDKVYVNTAVRPPAESIARRATDSALNAFYQTLDRPPLDDHSFPKKKSPPPPAVGSLNILGMVARRPVTIDDIAVGLSVPRKIAEQGVEDLLQKGKIELVEKDGRSYCRFKN